MFITYNNRERQSKTLPSITIIFPTLNGARTVGKLLDSIRNQTYPQKLIKVIAVDNHSSDDTVSIMKNFEFVKIVKYKKNTGSAPPITRAAKIAKSDLILATNDDLYFDKNCIKYLVDLYLTDTKIGVVTGKMLYATPPFDLIYGGFKINKYLACHPYDLGRSKIIHECDHAPGSCILVSKQLFKKIGYFDNAYIFCGDDFDLSYRIRQVGYKVMYHSKAVYYHHINYNLKTSKNPNVFFPHYRGKIRFILKNLPIYQIIPSLMFQIALGPIFTYIKFRNKTLIPLVKAIIWNLKNFEKTLKSRRQSKITISRIIHSEPKTKNYFQDSLNHGTN